VEKGGLSVMNEDSYTILVKQEDGDKEIVYSKGLSRNSAERSAKKLNRLKGLSARFLKESEMEKEGV
jgi:hypothetical protein